jgi:deoxyribodipyrimidine photo-lyase
MTTLVWFRQDLRVADNPALDAACAAGRPVIPVYVFAPHEEGAWAPGGASRWWLHHSLARLGQELADRGSRLILRSGDSLAVLTELASECGATNVVWNRRYEPAIVERDRGIKTALRAAGLTTGSFNGALLHEPWEAKTQSGAPFQVFTPFWRHCLQRPEPPAPTAAPQRLVAPRQWPRSMPLAELALLPRVAWDTGLQESWTPGSEAAHRHLERFLADSYDGYTERRDQPGVTGTSRMSPHLHFGEISPREIWHATRRYVLGRTPGAAWRESKFLAELGWREFAHHLLYHFPHTPQRPLRPAYARMPWRRDPDGTAAWRRGRTGYPIVDAGLRELWRTGWMHNRVRMITGSFLVKDLLVDWTEGASWFWDTLVDADLASNTLGWQWVAGCGADASPFFRIFNPTTQGEKFDPDGAYVRRWVPELARLPDEHLHRPWAAPCELLREVGIVLGRDYPRPILDHDAARRAALAALASIKQS